MAKRESTNTRGDAGPTSVVNVQVSRRSGARGQALGVEQECRHARCRPSQEADYLGNLPRHIGRGGSIRGSAALGSTTAATDKAGFPAAYPSFTYPVSDPGLPQDCRINNPNQHWSSEVGTSHLLRSTGGVTEARALAIPKANFPGVSGELSAFENEVGNCFYSSAVVQKHNRYEMVFGFKDASGPMNPAAIANYLRLQRFVIASVTRS